MLRSYAVFRGPASGCSQPPARVALVALRYRRALGQPPFSRSSASKSASISERYRRHRCWEMRAFQAALFRQIVCDFPPSTPVARSRNDWPSHGLREIPVQRTNGFVCSTLSPPRHAIVKDPDATKTRRVAPILLSSLRARRERRAARGENPRPRAQNAVAKAILDSGALRALA